MNYNKDLVHFTNHSPIGKKIYHIGINDLPNKEFLINNSLVNKPTFEVIHNRFEEIIRICRLLDCNLDFNKPTIQLHVRSEFELIEILNKNLPHLLIKD